MRKRTLDPNFFLDEYLVTQPFAVRLLFEGLWCLADREGRIEDRPVRIKMKLFPADDLDVDAALDALASGGMVARYEVDGQRVIQVTNFLKHQRPHPKEVPSILPPQGHTLEVMHDHLGVPQDTPKGSSMGVEPVGVRDLRSTGPSECRDLRSVGAPADAPAGRPAAPRPAQAKPLAYKPRLDVAWPGRPPVPGSLHAELRDKLGGDPDQADARLRAWYPTAAAPYDGQPIGDNDFAFWRHRFREWVGSTRQPDRARAAPAPVVSDDWCDHEPRCSSREWHAMLVAREQGHAREATA